MGATPVIIEGFTVGNVSIHAPVMGATAKTDAKRLSKSVSIHAPVMGATFDPSVIPEDSLVSIHAPVMGATKFIGRSFLQDERFDPRTRDGCDPQGLSLIM